MDLKAPLVFLLLNISACILTTSGQSTDPLEKVLSHAKATIKACGGETSVGEVVDTCVRTFIESTMHMGNTLDSFTQAGQELVDCLQPFKVLLDGCSSEAPDRDNDLLVLDAISTGLKDDAVFSGPPWTGSPCEHEENYRIQQVLVGCINQTSLFDDPLQPFLNFCRSMEDSLQCFTKVDNETNGCESNTKRMVDDYRTLLSAVRDKSEYPNLMRPCLGSLTHLV